jgi:hypothetical protein
MNTEQSSYTNIVTNNLSPFHLLESADAICQPETKINYVIPVNQTLPGRDLLNYSLPVRVWLLTSRLRTGKSLNFFFTVYCVF